MTKLSNNIRERIINRALAYTFDPRLAALKEEETVLAETVYLHAYSLDHRMQMASLPSGWLPEVTRLYVKFEGMQTSLNFLRSLRLPYNKYESWHGPITDRDIIDQWTRLEQLKTQYGKDRDIARNKLRSLLWSVSTVKALAELWPEGRQFYASDTTEPPRNAVIVRTDEINAILGLSMVGADAELAELKP